MEEEIRDWFLITLDDVWPVFGLVCGTFLCFVFFPGCSICFGELLEMFENVSIVFRLFLWLVQGLRTTKSGTAGTAK